MNLTKSEYGSQPLRPSDKPTPEIEQQFQLIDEALDRLTKAFSSLNARIQSVLTQSPATPEKPSVTERCCSSELGERLATLNRVLIEQAKAINDVAQRVAL